MPSRRDGTGTGAPRPAAPRRPRRGRRGTAAANAAPAANAASAGSASAENPAPAAQAARLARTSSAAARRSRGLPPRPRARAQTRPHARSWMLAIYQANPRAFEQNMNLLRSGAVLRMPDAATAAAVSPARPRRDPPPVRRLARAPAASEPAAAQPGRLKLVTPSEAPAAGARARGPERGRRRCRAACTISKASSPNPSGCSR